MRLVAISDTHHLHYYLKIPKGDILIHCGDFGFRGEKIERFLIKEWIRRQAKKYAYIVFIAGNHDINMTPDTTRDLPSNCYHLQDSGIELEGIKFYGSPYTVRFGNWGFGEPEESLLTRFNHIKKDTEILITHGPPWGILDQNQYQEHCGSKSLYERIKKLNKLKYHFFGHIHESYGQEQIEFTTFINCSVLDEKYQLKNKPVIINVE